MVRHLKQNLLGLPAIKALQLLMLLNSVSQSIPDQYPTLFTSLGTFPEAYDIKLVPDAQPFALFTPRNVPLPLRKKVEEELARMESLQVISKIDEPTPWCAGMVIVPKKSSDSVRICVDFRPLNDSVLREVHPLPKVEETLAQLSGATVFSKIDANCGFWQIPLTERSRLFTTFITPFGRYCFNKLPFGICSAPEHFQKQMNKILSELPGVLCHMDDVLIFGGTQQEHDERLHKVLQKLQSAGATLNREKCEFNKKQLSFLGHIVNEHGVSPDPLKTAAILNMDKPKTPTELRRFLGMVNQLSKFSPFIATVTKPLRELLSTKKSWSWGHFQDQAKSELTKPTVLALYDPAAKTKICADASSYGLGAVLLQQHSQQWRSVAYASRAMTETEQRYSQIEREAQGIVWSCEKFSDYIIGKTINLETDHKPLVPLLSKTNLDRLPPRVLRFRLRLMQFDYTISHVPGKLLYTADALSRAPIANADVDYCDHATELFVQSVLSYLPASTDRLDVFRKAQSADPTCAKLMNFCSKGWPNRKEIQGDLLQYSAAKLHLSVVDNLLLYANRIVVPHSMRAEVLQKVHQGHQGIQRCRLRISSAVWWPRISRDIEDYIKSCPICQQSTIPPTEPLLQTKLPNHPWERVAADLFQLKGKSYLVVVDYFSRYVEVQSLSITTSASVVNALKAIFARHGIPATFVSDNGPQFDSQEMKRFAECYGFNHVTSSPHYPQSNGLAERTVKTIKSLFANSQDPYMALMSYRATPLPFCKLSPAELSMGRQIRTDVPQLKTAHIPTWPYLENFRVQDEKYKAEQKHNYDKRHRVRPLPSLPDKTPVWVTTDNRNVPGRIIQQSNTPRSYIIDTQSGKVRRNRSQLRIRSEHSETETSQSTIQTPNHIVTRCRTGTAIKPTRLNL